MLVALDDDGALVGDCRADAVGADARLAPHGAGPETQPAKIMVVAGRAAAFERNAVLVGQQQAAARLADRRKQPVQLALCFLDQMSGFFPRRPELLFRQPERRAGILRGQSMHGQAAAPGGGDGRTGCGRHVVCNGLNMIRMFHRLSSLRADANLTIDNGSKTSS
jgi:hypothetical protein